MWSVGDGSPSWSINRSVANTRAFASAAWGHGIEQADLGRVGGELVPDRDVEADDLSTGAPLFELVGHHRLGFAAVASPRRLVGHTHTNE